LRIFILALSVLGILVSANVAKAGPSMTDRDLLASADPGTIAQEATQETEDRIGLDKAKRRDVQRRLTGLGFDKSDDARPARRRGGGHHRSIGGPGQLIGGVVGGLFGRR
jgi:hypothetical protein